MNEQPIDHILGVLGKLDVTAYRTPNRLTSSAASSPVPHPPRDSRRRQGLRLVFEREWRIPQDTDPQRLLDDVLGFLPDALTIALSEDMPAARRELACTTSEVIRELVAA
ncbi:MAG TPA: hypothetical protein VFE59_26550 [Trebonia sp.]|nr:hypothetical protein [Trebonia sp.]